MIIAIAIGVSVAAALALATVYNRLVRLRNAVENAFSTIDVQLKQRCDLVPRVVDAFRGYMHYERTVLEQLTALRERAMAGGLDTPARLGLDAQMGALLTQLFARVEAYPDLKAAQSVALLQRTLNDIEGQIAAARRAYNAAAAEYNTAIESVPANFVARPLGFSRRTLFEASAAEQAAPDLSSVLGR